MGGAQRPHSLNRVKPTLCDTFINLPDDELNILVLKNNDETKYIGVWIKYMNPKAIA